MDTLDDATANELLARHGIATLSSPHAAPEGGRVVDVLVAKDIAGAILTLVIGKLSASCVCPLEEEEALKFVRAFRGRGLPADDSSMERMLAHLLVKISDLFFDSGAETLEFEAIHLHQSAYQIRKVRISGAPPLHVRARLAHDAHDRHAIFDHRHGDDVKFPK